MESQRLALLGDPVRHSRSPAMQRAALAAAGLSGWSYDAIPVARGALAGFWPRVCAGEFAGLNLTIPHKRAVLSLLDEIDPAALEIGAVNTVVVLPGGTCGFNTDVDGIRRPLAERGLSLAGARVLVLGAGGAARAAVAAARLDGAERVAIAARDRGAALALAADLGRVSARSASGGSLIARGWQERADEVAALTGGARAVIIHATPIGLHDRESTPLEGIALSADSVVFDCVYGDPKRRLVRDARAAGATVVDGLDMLVHQGARAFELWTGQPADLAAMRRAASAGDGPAVAAGD